MLLLGVRPLTIPKRGDIMGEQFENAFGDVAILIEHDNNVEVVIDDFKKVFFDYDSAYEWLLKKGFRE